MEILQQLGELVLGSLPTIALFLLIVVAYTLLVHRPLHRVLAERRELTTGAVERARDAISTAELKTDEYEGRLRSARHGVSLAREHRVQQWATEREEVLSAARERAQMKVKTAKVELEQGAAEARQQIERTVDQLASQVLAAVLPGQDNSSQESAGAR
jgi:F-type H+-transporting ATPase subunit b